LDESTGRNELRNSCAQREIIRMKLIFLNDFICLSFYSSVSRSSVTVKKRSGRSDCYPMNAKLPLTAAVIKTKN
jgi:hypothetical protein